jgi:hypothetical protein
MTDHELIPLPGKPVRYTAEKISRTKTVKLRMEHQPTHVGPDDRPTWTIKRPGSYAPGYEHTATETYAVRHAAFMFDGPSLGWWQLRSVTLELDGPDGNTTLTHVQPGEDTTMPVWLAELAVIAVQTEE